MEKTLLLKRQEFIDNLVQLINDSNLPLVIILPILNDILKEVNANVQQQYQKEKQSYMEQKNVPQQLTVENENTGA